MKQKKPIPKGAVIGLVVVAALLVAFVGYTLLVKPQKKQLSDVNQQIRLTQQTIDNYKASVAASKPSVAPQVKVADIYRLARAMPSSEQMADLLVELDSLARSSGVQIGSIAPSAPTAGNGFQIVLLTVNFSGDFYASTDFLYRLRTLVDVRHGQLESGGRIFAIQQGTLTTGTGSALSGQVALQTYLYSTDTSASSAATAPPATPTSTDTTSTDTTTTSTSAEGAP